MYLVINIASVWLILTHCSTVFIKSAHSQILHIETLSRSWEVLLQMVKKINKMLYKALNVSGGAVLHLINYLP